jgi:hypothetical protein
MSEPKKPTGVRSIRVYVPGDVADHYQAQAALYNTSISAAASPVLCAMARGEIRQDFSQRPGTDVRPR